MILEEDDSGTINVAIRIRPLSNSEKERGDVAAWNVSEDRDKIIASDALKEYIEKEGENNKTDRSRRNTPHKRKAFMAKKKKKRTVNPASTKRKLPTFKEGNVFDSSFDTKSLFDSVGKPIVKEAMRGINGTILAYGQTSSGKTHTMLGNQSTPGIILLSVIEIFHHINKNPNRAFLLRVSMVEIYNEVVRDLLNPKATRLQVYNDRQRGVIIQGVKEEIVTSPDRVWELLDTGFGNRAVGSTGLNAESSRSHTVFRLIIESRNAKAAANEGKGKSKKVKVRVSTLNIVDLAGSERTADAGTTGGRRTEGVNINKSLMTLGGVIRKLVNDPDGHIPYRNSQLTRILQRSLGGNAKTSIICTIAPSQRHFEESRTTLSFAANANRVKTRAKVNEVDMRMSIMGAHEAEMSKLRQQLKNFGISATAAVHVNNNGGTNNTSHPGDNTATTSGNSVFNERLNAELKEQQQKVVAEQKETTELRAQLEANLQHLTKLVLTATHVAKDSQFATLGSSLRYSDSGAAKHGSGSTRKKVRQTWGPREIQSHFASSSSFKDAQRNLSSGSFYSASSFMDETEQLRCALESIEGELLEVNGMLEGERQSRMEAETQAMKMDSYLGLLTDGVGIEDKSPEELNSLEQVFLQGLQRVIEARHMQTVQNQRDSYEEKLFEMQTKYEKEIETLKNEKKGIEESFQKETSMLKQNVNTLKTDLHKTGSAKKNMEKKLEIKERIFDEELKKVKSNSLKTEIALRSKQEEIRNQLEETKKHNDENKSGDENSIINLKDVEINGKNGRPSLAEKFQNNNTTTTSVDSPMKMLFEKARKKSIGRSKMNKIN